jgi:D-alanine-D-alanine ligase
MPLVVKPVVGGSSVGMSIVREVSDLQGAVEKAFEFDTAVMVEGYIDGVELTGGVIGNSDLEAFPLIEIIPDQEHDFFDYEAKYTSGITQEICRGYSRTDLILKDRDMYVLETNTIPGMTATSLLPQAAQAAGLSFTKLLDRLIELGMEEK